MPRRLWFWFDQPGDAYLSFMYVVCAASKHQPEQHGNQRRPNPNGMGFAKIRAPENASQSHDITNLTGKSGPEIAMQATKAE